MHTIFEKHFDATAEALITLLINKIVEGRYISMPMFVRKAVEAHEAKYNDLVSFVGPFSDKNFEQSLRMLLMNSPEVFAEFVANCFTFSGKLES